MWSDWDKIRRRILDIMSKYLESEEEKRINYLRRKLLQWKDTRDDICRNKIARCITDKYKTAVGRNNWKDLVNKYDMFVNKSLLYQVKSRLRNWLKLRDMVEKWKKGFTKVGLDQLKEGVEFKKTLELMRQLFTNLEERNKFLAKRFFTRKWYMQCKKMKDREDKLENAIKEMDNKYLTNFVNTMGDVFQITKVEKAVLVARARDFFTQIKKLWGDVIGIEFEA